MKLTEITYADRLERARAQMVAAAVAMAEAKVKYMVARHQGRNPNTDAEILGAMLDTTDVLNHEIEAVALLEASK